MFTFLLNVEKDHSDLTLLQNGTEIAKKTWPEVRDMGRQLFEAVHALLTENGLKPEEIGDFQLETRVSDNFTSVKIAQTVAAVYTWGVKVLSSEN